MDTVEIIKELQATNGRLDKEAILLNAWNSGNRDFFNGAYYCYNPFITFGVADKSVTAKDKSENIIENKYSHENYVSLMENLRNRSITGNAAKKEIELAAEKSDTEEWNLFYRAILLKDLRCGLSETTINKILKKIGTKEAKEYIIPVFECQLAHDGLEETFEGRYILQEKLDGVRLLILCDIDSKSVTMHTRNGKINKNFPHITKVFEDLLPKLKTSMVFDGEVVGESFQSLMKQVNRKEDVNSKVTKIAIFDCLTLSDFKSGKSKMGQLQRIELLDTFPLFSADNPDSPVFKLESLIVDMTTIEGRKQFDDFNKKAIAAGKEGIMVKAVDAPYECKRSKSWLKIKPFIEETLEIVSVEEGTGKNIGRLGNLICKGLIQEKEVNVSVGSGFSDEEREEIWGNRKNLKGMLIEVRADCLTKDQNSDTIWSMRFPRFKGFRGSVPGEKI